MTQFTDFRVHRNIIAMLIAIAWLALMFALSGCSITTVDRGDNGELNVSHKTFMSKVAAPSLEVERKGEDIYTARYNAESRGSDADQFLRIACTFNPAACGIPDGE